MDGEKQGLFETPARASALHYDGTEEPRIPAWLLVGAVAIVAAAASFAFKWLNLGARL